MKPSNITLAATLLSATLLALSGCGGGSSPTAPAAPSITLSGVAATGAAFVGAVVTVIDSRGTVVGTSSGIGDDGRFNVTLRSDAQAPFVLIASRTDANGETQNLVSVVESATQTTANITPITTLIASRLSPSGDPTQLDEELASNRATITSEAVAATVAEVKAILAPLLAATGTASADPLKDPFATDGTGYDRLLDSLSISIVPTSATEANIEIAVKSTDNPPPLTFTSSTPSVTPVTSVTEASLVQTGTSVKIADFLSRLTACYAIPTTERVSGSTVTGAACTSVFFQGNPANFLHNGGTVGPTGAFASLFNTGAVGVQFSQGTYEFTRANGDIVAGYKITDPQGNVRYDTLVLRSDSEGARLNLIGNQYAHPGKVAAFQQKRQFITLDQGDYSYYSTGYSIEVTNRVVGGAPVYNRVVVTTPKGKRLVLRPQAGSSYLVFYKNDNPDSTTAPEVNTGTNFVRLRSEYLDGSTTRPHPRTIDTNLVFARNDLGVLEDYTDSELTSIPNQSEWTIEYFLNSAPTTVAATQRYRTRARSMTIGELRTQGMASLTPEAITQAQGYAQSVTDTFPGQILSEANGTFDIVVDGGGDAWSVPTGTVAPTSILLFGNGATSFNDTVNVASSARSATVPCSSQGPSDTHCGSVAGSYAAGVRFNGLQLLSTDAAGRSFGSFHAMYKVTVPAL